MKQLKYKSSEPIDVKAVCRKYYNLLRECYKYEAGIGTSGRNFGVPMNQFAASMQDLNMIDKKFQLSDADRFFITVNSSTAIKNNPMVPKNSLIRFQYLEIIVRVSIAKFYPDTCDTEAGAVEKFFKDYLVPGRENDTKVNAHKWRVDNIWCEPVDNILKAYKDFFKALYDKCGSIKLPGKPAYVDVEDLEKMFIDIEDLFSEGCLAQRDISLGFLQAMITQIDEINNDRHVHMTFPEFLEAIVRIVDKASPATPLEVQEEAKAEEAEKLDDLKKLPKI